MMSLLKLDRGPAFFLAGLFFCGSLWAADAPRKSAGPKVGGVAPQFSLNDRTGKSFSLEQFRGNLVLLNFWATWCPPCVKELPSMEYLNQHFKAKNFTMMAVSVDESWAVIDEFFSNDRFFSRRSPSFLVLRDPEKRVAEGLYGCTGWPETYIISPTGKLLEKFEGEVNWTDKKIIQKLEEWLKIK